MPFVEFFLLRLVVWFGLFLALVALAVGPRRLWRGVKRIWTITWRKRLDPEEILTQVVKQHEQHVKAVGAALGQAEQAEAAIRGHLRQSEDHVTALSAEAARLAEVGDNLGARAALYKINLENSAIENFRDQLARQCDMVAESRHRLFMLELQLRQYEVGRSILLSQLAQAEKVEEQYAIARRFDPFNAVANWQKAEGLVQEKALNARAIERVYTDISELAAAGSPTDPVILEAQLAELQSQLKKANQTNNNASSAKIVGGTASNQSAAQSDSPHTIEQNPLDPEKSS